MSSPHPPGFPRRAGSRSWPRFGSPSRSASRRRNRSRPHPGALSMATAVQPRLELSHSISWLRDFLREELAPYPGRMAKVARMGLAATIMMIADMTFKVPNPAFSIIFAVVLAREDPEGPFKQAESTL